jgi:hypothetical protein
MPGPLEDLRDGLDNEITVAVFVEDRVEGHLGSPSSDDGFGFNLDAWDWYIAFEHGRGFVECGHARLRSEGLPPLATDFTSAMRSTTSALQSSRYDSPPAFTGSRRYLWHYGRHSRTASAAGERPSF